MPESLESIFRRVVSSHGYEIYNEGRVYGRHDIDNIVELLSHYAEARCELIRQEGHDQGWLDCEAFHDIRPDS